MLSKRKWLNTFLACILGGILGLHRFYVGRCKEAALSLIITIVGAILAGIAYGLGRESSAALALIIIGGLLLLAVAIWWLVDLILICTHKYKDRESLAVADDLK